MYKLICCVLSITAAFQARAGYLDPRVFANLTGIPMPDAKGNYDLGFEFVASENQLMNVDVLNATYDVSRVGNLEWQINLNIPLQEINLRGKYKSSLSLPLPRSLVDIQQQRRPKKPNTEIKFVNQGHYTVALQGVFLSFQVQSEKTTGFLPRLSYCVPTIEEVDITVTEETEVIDDDENILKLDRDTVEIFVNFMSKDQYNEMFCDAMRRVLGDSNNVIMKALISRFTQAYQATPKKSG